jgi:sugar phosphate isomerase/epimerase
MAWTFSAFTDEAGAEIDAQIAACKRGGLKHADLRSVGKHNITTLPLAEAEQVQKQLAAAGVSVNMYGSPIGKIDITDDVQIDLDKLAHLAELSKVFGCKAVRMFSYFNKTKLPQDQWKAKAFDNLRRLCDLASKHGLVLYHENESHIYGDHPDQVLEIAELRSDTFKLIYDFANYIRTGVAGWDSWQMFRDKTDAFHFKDQRKSGEHTPMGQGETDAKRILADAAAMGWTGPCTLEPHLRHSGVVLATHASGSGMKSLQDLSGPDIFQIAVEAAQNMMTELKVKYD